MSVRFMPFYHSATGPMVAGCFGLVFRTRSVYEQKKAREME
jgi:hypothetical protein